MVDFDEKERGILGGAVSANPNSRKSNSFWLFEFLSQGEKFDLMRFHWFIFTRRVASFSSFQYEC